MTIPGGGRLGCGGGAWGDGHGLAQLAGGKALADVPKTLDELGLLAVRPELGVLPHNSSFEFGAGKLILVTWFLRSLLLMTTRGPVSTKALRQVSSASAHG